MTDYILNIEWFEIRKWKVLFDYQLSIFYYMNWQQGKL